MPSALELIESSRQRLERADLFYGHGTDNPEDDAIFLVLHGLGLGYDASEEQLSATVSASARASVDALVARRITERVPSAYLTNRMWFADLEFYVDERVLVPRSPLAEIILSRFAPWSDSGQIRRVLEIGTGSGCIALAVAHYLPRASVIATDISADALEVAKLNLERHEQLRDRVQFVHADLYPAGLATTSDIPGDGFDLIITNPPYVPASQMEVLPAEYKGEPEMALLAGEEGLEYIKKIFAEAVEWLAPQGVVFFDVGNRWAVLEEAFPNLPIVWCELERGGEGIGMLDRQSLKRSGGFAG